MGNDSLVAKNLRITHCYDVRLYIFSKENILLVIRAADRFIKNDHSPVPFYDLSSSRHARSFLDEHNPCILNDDKDKFSIFAQLLYETFSNPE